MSTRRIVWQGTTYVTLNDAASCYGVEVREIQVWVEQELLEPPRSVEGRDVIPVTQLDRLAALIRYTRVLGLEPDVIRLLL